MSCHSELDADIRTLGTTPQEVIEGAGPCSCGSQRTITGISPESGFEQTVVRVALWCKTCMQASHCRLRHKLEVEAEEEERMPKSNH